MSRSRDSALTVARYLEWFHVGRYVNGLIAQEECEHDN